MPLTPEDISLKKFTAVRLREGYEMAEVDQFLDEVEAELARLITENDDLRAKLSDAQKGLPVAASAKADSDEKPSKVKASEKTDAAAPAPTEIKVTNVAEASSAAAKLLEIATRNADEVVVAAKEEADGILGSAKQKAERLEVESKKAAEDLESDARARAKMLDEETETKRQDALGAIEAERAALTEEVDGLRTFEREYRGRLKTYLSEQLEALESPAAESATPKEPASGSPKRLKSILGDDGAPQGDSATS